MAIKRIEHPYSSASSSITAGHVDYVYRENEEEPVTQSPQQACKEGCVDALSASFGKGCSPLGNFDHFFKLCETRCETLMRIIYGFNPTETDQYRFYQIIGFGIGQKILEENSLNSLSQCSVSRSSPMPAPAAEPMPNSASPENKITRYIEEGLFLGAITFLSYSVLAKVAWLSKMNVGATLIRGELKYAKVSAFSNALARRSYFLKA